MRWGIAAVIPPHITFYDIDTHGLSESEMWYIQNNTNLLYSTSHGYHAFSYKYDPRIRSFCDNKCPHNAVRVYPDTDYKIVGYYGLWEDPFIHWLGFIHGWTKRKLDVFYEPELKPYVKPRMRLK